jgi:hypothetical protein
MKTPKKDNASRLRIVNDTFDKLGGDVGVIFKYTAIALNLLQFGMLMYEVLWLFQKLLPFYSYYAPWTTDCSLTYDLGINRWIYLLHMLFTIPDIAISFFIGQKTIGQLTPFFNVAQIVFNFIIACTYFGVWFWIFPCNSPSNNAFLNPCTDIRACGISSFINDTASGCDAINPSGLILYPPISEGELRWNIDFSMMFVALGIHVGFGLLKTIANFLIPGTTESLRNTLVDVVSFIQNIDKLNIKKAIADVPSQIKEKSKKFTVGIQELSFFFNWTSWQKKLYAPMIVLHVLYCLCYVAWVGWFEVNVKSIRTKYTETVVGVTAVTVLTPAKKWDQIIFYMIASANLICVCFNQWVGFKDGGNGLAIASSIFGLINNFAGILYAFFFYIISCFMNGHPNNVCANKRWKGQDPITYPNNGYSHTYACPTQVSSPGWDTEFAILFIFFCYWFVTNVLFVAYSIWIQFSLNKIKAKDVSDLDQMTEELIKEEGNQLINATKNETINSKIKVF